MSFFSSHVFLFQHVSFPNVSGFDWLKQISVSIFKKWLKDETGGKRCKALRVCVRKGERTSPEVCGVLHVVLCKEASACVCGMGWAWDSMQWCEIQPGDICWEAGQHICKCALLLRKWVVVKCERWSRDKKKPLITVPKVTLESLLSLCKK